MYKFLKIIVLTLILSLILILGLTAQNKKSMTEKQYLDYIKLKMALDDNQSVHKYILELFEKHGLSPEAVYLYEQSLGRMFDETEDIEKRTTYLEQMYSYSDSLKNLCLVKDSTAQPAQRDCPKFVKAVDSIKISYRKKLYGEN